MDNFKRASVAQQ